MTTEFNIPSLSSIFIPYDKLSADWRTYQKDPERYIHRFISINRRSFDFLGVSASYVVQNYKSGLLLFSSKYVGSAPLLSPISGKPAYDLNVTPMYGEDLGRIISLLGERVDVEYAPMKLQRPITFRVPVYFVCIEYMLAFSKAIECNWTKFNTRITFEKTPSGTTDWGKYARESFSPERRLQFANTKSFHTPEHKEWLELTGLLSAVLETYSESRPPMTVRCRYESLVLFLKEYVRTHPLATITLFPPDASSDPPAIKLLKGAGRRFLHQNNDSAKAWRIEIAVLFERFVQHIMCQASCRTGWNCHCNEHYVINNSMNMRWTLRYLEPDAVLTRGAQQWVVDAKYKSHMYNQSSYNVDILKSSFREDYHQVLAYTSFSSTNERHSLIVYPCDHLCKRKLIARSPLSRVVIDTYLLGLPFTTEKVEEAIVSITDMLSAVDN